MLNRSYTFIFVLLLTGSLSFVRAETLSGRIYEGSVGNQSTPISGVSVQLYGSANEGSLGSQIDNTTTDATGWYGLFTESGFEYYTIVASNKTGYESVGAISVGGTVMNHDRIQYSVVSEPLSGQTLTGNKFWDKKTAPANNPPVADANGPYTGKSGQSIALDGSGSYDPDAGDSIADYSWDLDNDSQYDDASGVSPNKTWSAAGFFTIGLKVTDTHGVTDTDNTTVTVAEKPGEAEGSIGDWVWHDLNENGIQDNGEPGVSGVTVQLYDDQGHLQATKTTGADGKYLFTALSDGNYYITIILPYDYMFTTQNQGADDAIDSDINSQTGDSQTIQLAAGEADRTVDAGLVFNDEDEYDFGDAPSSYGIQPYFNVHTSFKIGQSVDAEAAAQSYLHALGDDQNDLDDEDGVKFMTPLIPGQSAQIEIDLTHAKLTDPPQTWLFIDFNSDGDWMDADEQNTSLSLIQGIKNTVTVHVPQGAQPGITFARIAIIDRGPLPPNGTPYGEIEDYEIFIQGQTDDGSITLIKEAAPADDTPFRFCLYYSSGFFNIFCSDLKDPANNQMIVINPGLLDSVAEASQAGWLLKDIQITDDSDNGSSVDLSNLSVTVDFDPGENITIRFINKKIPDGEYDFGDAPAGYPDAGHLLGGPWLGGLQDAPDTESWSQNSPASQGDNSTGQDDENGIIKAQFIIGQWGEIHTRFVPGQSGHVTIGFWADFNRDGDWDDPGESVTSTTSAPLPSGTVCQTVLIWNLPADIVPGPSTLRMRIYEGQNVTVSHTGFNGPGEVEDHEIEIIESGEPQPEGSLVQGYKWHDLDGNSVWEPGEPAIDHWLIWLDFNQNGIMDNMDPGTFTDGTGYFSIPGIPSGAYHLYEEHRSGWTQTFPVMHEYHSVTVQAGQASPLLLFGNRQDSTVNTSAIKWSQPFMEQYIPILDLVCGIGWPEKSLVTEAVIADDWFCYDPRPVISVTWWGAYADWDSLYPPSNTPDRFHITLLSHARGTMHPDSALPQERLLTWIVDRYSAGEELAGACFDRDHMEQPLSCFAYHYAVPEDAWFYQNGDSTIYWLMIAAEYDHPETGLNVWGWATREHYFHADAVRLIPIPDDAGYNPHDRIGPRRDMAFELGTTDILGVFDFGDAPDEGYGTLRSGNGAQHLIRPDVRLGPLVDAEPDGQPHPDAMGDDAGSDDEDGVEFVYPLTIGEGVHAEVSVSAGGYLSAWLDRDRNGGWSEPEDHILQDIYLERGGHVLDIPDILNLEPDAYMLRFRFSTEPNLWFRGFAMDGEVEDYLYIHEGTDVEESDPAGAHSSYILHQIYPNPFNPSSRIRFEVPITCHVNIRVFNLIGQDIVTLINDVREAGNHTIAWDTLDAHGKQAPAGIYFVHFQAGGKEETVKLILLK